MHYVCIENNEITAILNYEPNVPGSVSVVAISDGEYQSILDRTHFFDVVTRHVKPVPQTVLDQDKLRLANAQYQEFLNSTDWKVMRHIREKALGGLTTLSDSEYIDLENQRKQAAASIVKV